jgi:hypothetical protein
MPPKNKFDYTYLRNYYDQFGIDCSAYENVKLTGTYKIELVCIMEGCENMSYRTLRNIPGTHGALCEECLRAAELRKKCNPEFSYEYDNLIKVCEKHNISCELDPKKRLAVGMCLSSYVKIAIFALMLNLEIYSIKADYV